MNIFITLDYELFFGDTSGTIEKCLLQPTERLLQLAEKYNARFTFFVDIGYIIAMKKWESKFPELTEQRIAVENQIKQMIQRNCDVQLHIHPHWEKAEYTTKGWDMKLDDCYKLSDFNQADAHEIVERYKSQLEETINRETHSFRAGGWCVQPFEHVRASFKKLGIKYDTSVFPGGKFSSQHYAFDFTNAPKKSIYNFEHDVTVADEHGFFTELPISSAHYGPLFYWRLYVLGRLFPKRHKMMGDGNFVPQPGRKWENLKFGSWNHVSCDGYFSSALNRVAQQKNKRGDENMVVIGHPKSMTLYAFEQLEKFLKRWQHKANFQTFNDLP